MAAPGPSVISTSGMPASRVTTLDESPDSLPEAFALPRWTLPARTLASGEDSTSSRDLKLAPNFS